MNSADAPTADPTINALFSVGAHFGYRRSKRHPTAASYIFATKGGVEIFDLPQTRDALAKAEEFVKGLAQAGKSLLFVGGKREASNAVQENASRIGMPFVSSRWIGGTLTNFSQIRSRIDKMLELVAAREKGELGKYTKKERLLIDREVARLETLFHGLVPLAGLPAALFVVDPKHEDTAVAEAKRKNLPVIALASSDCDLGAIAYPIPGNDASRASIQFFVEKIAAAYAAGANEKLKAQNKEI